MFSFPAVKKKLGEDVIKGIIMNCHTFGEVCRVGIQFFLWIVILGYRVQLLKRLSGLRRIYIRKKKGATRASEKDWMYIYHNWHSEQRSAGSLLICYKLCPYIAWPDLSHYSSSFSIYTLTSLYKLAPCMKSAHLKQRVAQLTSSWMAESRCLSICRCSSDDFQLAMLREEFVIL